VGGFFMLKVVDKSPTYFFLRKLLTSRQPISLLLKLMKDKSFL